MQIFCLSLVTFLLLTGALLQIGLQLIQLHTLRGVGWCQQAGRVQCQALVVAHVGMSREGVLQLQALQLLGQDRLTAAQVTMRSSGLRRLCRGGTVQVCSGAGNRVGDHLMGQILEGSGRSLAVCGRPIESLMNIKSINNRCRNTKVPHFLLRGQRARYLFLHIGLGLGFTAGESAYELLQMSELLEQSGLHDGFTQLQVKGAVGQDERRVAVEALQDVGCRIKDKSSITNNPRLSNEMQPSNLQVKLLYLG